MSQIAEKPRNCDKRGGTLVVMVPRQAAPTLLHAYRFVRKNLIEGVRRNLHSGVKVEDEAIYVDEPDTVPSPSRRNMVWFIERGTNQVPQIILCGSGTNLWITLGRSSRRESLGRWVSAEDNSGDKTSTIQEVGRRHGSLPWKLELEKFKPPTTAANGGALARELRNHARGDVCGEVGVCRQRAGSEDLHPVDSLESARTWFGGKSSNKIVGLRHGV